MTEFDDLFEERKRELKEESQFDALFHVKASHSITRQRIIDERIERFYKNREETISPPGIDHLMASVAFPKAVPLPPTGSSANKTFTEDPLETTKKKDKPPAVFWENIPKPTSKILWIGDYNSAKWRIEKVRREVDNLNSTIALIKPLVFYRSKQLKLEEMYAELKLMFDSFAVEKYEKMANEYALRDDIASAINTDAEEISTSKLITEYNEAVDAFIKNVEDFMFGRPDYAQDALYYYNLEKAAFLKKPLFTFMSAMHHPNTIRDKYTRTLKDGTKRIKYERHFSCDSISDMYAFLWSLEVMEVVTPDFFREYTGNMWIKPVHNASDALLLFRQHMISPYAVETRDEDNGGFTLTAYFDKNNELYRLYSTMLKINNQLIAAMDGLVQISSKFRYVRTKYVNERDRLISKPYDECSAHDPASFLMLQMNAIIDLAMPYISKLGNIKF